MEHKHDHQHGDHEKHAHHDHDHSEHDHAQQQNAGHDHAKHDHSQHQHAGHVHGKKGHDEHHGHHDHHAHMVADFRKRFWISLVITIPILLLSPLIAGFLGIEQAVSFPGQIYVLFILASAVFFYGGYPFLNGMREELSKMRPGMMTLIAVAIVTAYIYSAAVVFGLKGKMFFWELATLVDIMLLGHWIEMKSVMGASRALEEMAKLMPKDAHKIMADGSTADIPISDLHVGDRVLIKPGEKLPADGKVIDGESWVDESLLTGESKPIRKKAGMPVVGGAINGDGSLTVEVTKAGADSFLSQAIELVRQAQESKSKTQDLANRAALWLTIIALTAGAGTLLVWLFVMDKDLAFALERAVTVMVITCPHALGLAIPLVVAVSTALSSRNGLLIRNRTAFEQARNIDAIIFDKTGTLTQGKFGVTDILRFQEDYDEDELLNIAAAVENHSEHPIARGIVSSAKKPHSVENFKAIPGKGAQGLVKGKSVKVVSPGYLQENGIQIADKRIGTLSAQGKTVVFLIIDDTVQAAIAMADIIREESKQAISRLKKMGIKSMMLTGDNRQVAQWVSEELGLDEFFAEVLPHEKAEKVREVQSKGLIVAMTGDGVNDAPALAQADVGIAIGAGTDVAVETADIVLVRSNPLDVVALIGFAKATYRKMVQNLAWATGYNVFAIPLAAGVMYSAGILLSPAMGAVLMSLSTVVVAINARFLKIK